LHSSAGSGWVSFKTRMLACVSARILVKRVGHINGVKPCPKKGAWTLLSAIIKTGGKAAKVFKATQAE